MLQTHQLHVSIAANPICADLTLSVNGGERWCILGRNGAGKTTLLHTLAGLRDPQDGVVQLDDKDLNRLPRKQIARRMGVLFQDTHDPFPATVLETTLAGRHPYLGLWDWESADDTQRALDALTTVGLQGFESRQVGTLSGGERRRLDIAMLLTQDPALFLLDEPTNHLDLHHQVGMLTRIAERTGDGAHALIMVLHDLNLAARFADHFILLFGDGRHRMGHRDQVLNTTNLEQLYGHPLQEIGNGTTPAWLPA